MSRVRYGARSEAERPSQQRGEIVSRVPSEWLLPFAHQRYDNLSPIGTSDDPDDG